MTDTHEVREARTCARCQLPLLPGQRIVSDPCCGAPDCDYITDESHFACLPKRLQEIERWRQ